MQPDQMPAINDHQHTPAGVASSLPLKKRNEECMAVLTGKN